jgi:hypothetical protein
MEFSRCDGARPPRIRPPAGRDQSIAVSALMAMPDESAEQRIGNGTPPDLRSNLFLQLEDNAVTLRAALGGAVEIASGVRTEACHGIGSVLAGKRHSGAGLGAFWRLAHGL